MSRVKLIAEPWDVGEGGYQVGNFPPLWSEWNGKYRDWIRDYWRGEPGSLPELGLAAHRQLATSIKAGGRFPHASINFVTSHDGFTLRDLVSYNDKHNEANGEDNRDGESYNRSWNCGAEGDTDDKSIRELRARQQRNFLATMFLSQGVPMLLGGDELGRTQRGNNNALLPGQRAVVVRLGARRPRARWTSSRSCRGCAALHPFSGAAAGSKAGRFRPHAGGEGLPDIAWSRSGRRGDDRRSMGRVVVALGAGRAQRRRHPVPDMRGKPITTIRS